jgi:hypothetical protein
VTKRDTHRAHPFQLRRFLLQRLGIPSHRNNRQAQLQQPFARAADGARCYGGAASPPRHACSRGVSRKRRVYAVRCATLCCTGTLTSHQPLQAASIRHRRRAQTQLLRRRARAFEPCEQSKALQNMR